MALTRTTLSSAITVDDNAIVVASATGFAAGKLVKIDQEIMQIVQSYVSGTTVGVLRGREGTLTAAHPASAGVVVGNAVDDFSSPPPGATASFATSNYREVRSYSAAGAIALPTPGADMVAIINGTAKAMTVAVPTTDMDGSLLIITNDTGAAHTVTITGGAGGVGATADVYTFAGGQKQALIFVACNATWNAVGVVAGAATVAGAGVA